MGIGCFVKCLPRDNHRHDDRFAGAGFFVGATGSLSEVTSPTGGLLARFLSVCAYELICFFAFGFGLTVASVVGAGVAFLVAFFFAISARFLLSAIWPCGGSFRLFREVGQLVATTG